MKQVHLGLYRVAQKLAQFLYALTLPAQLTRGGIFIANFLLIMTVK